MSEGNTHDTRSLTRGTRLHRLHALGRTFAVVLLATTALTLAACGDPIEVEEHADAEGVAIYEGTTELYRYMLDDGAEPALELTVGSREVAFVLLDHDGEPLVHGDHGGDEEELVLEITIDDETVLTWTPEEHGDEEHTTVEFHGELSAVTAGSTTMRLCVPHGVHCDFEADVPVTVTD